MSRPNRYVGEREQVRELPADSKHIANLIEKADLATLEDVYEELVDIEIKELEQKLQSPPSLHHSLIGPTVAQHAEARRKDFHTVIRQWALYLLNTVADGKEARLGGLFKDPGVQIPAFCSWMGRPEEG